MPLWPIVVYFAIVLIVVAGMLGISYVLGEHHHGHATDEPYESGITPLGSARGRHDTRFYLMGILFVIFDLETVFVLAWAAAFRDLGWLGYIEMVIFIGVLFATLVYLWRMGALDWGTRRRGSSRKKERV
jgi:NADH-quinone oxidoreductase subunit A